MANDADDDIEAVNGHDGFERHLDESRSEDEITTELAQCFLLLANLDSVVLERLSRYEAALWRRAAQTVIALNAMRR